MAHYPRPKTREEAERWIAWTQANYARDGFGLWVVEDADGVFVGDCGLTWQTVDGVEDLELGYHVLPAHQGCGLATEGALACRELARERGVERLIAIIRPENVASQRVAKKAGLALERETEHGGLPVRIYAADLTTGWHLREEAARPPPPCSASRRLDRATGPGPPLVELS